MRPENYPRHGSFRPGFTLLELLVAMVLSSVVLLGVFGMLSAENRRTSQQRELSDSWLTLRSAMALMAFDLRQAGPQDLMAVTDSSITIRSRYASGVVCGRSTTAPAYALAGVTGTFTTGAADSVRVMTVELSPAWKTLAVAAVGSPGTVGPAACVWPGSAAPGAGVSVAVVTAADTAAIGVGSVVHAFRSIQYGVTSHAGRRWLGRRAPGISTWELLTGPLADDGLRMVYYTAAGTITNNPLEVASVRLTLVSESYGRNISSGNTISDSLSVRVQLRN
jgi:prepilin-type N-terminal cleavage/methylation domain-containing protein